jgi:hypothetical protein
MGFIFFYLMIFISDASAYGSPKDIVIHDTAFFARILSYLKYDEIVGLKRVKKPTSSQWLAVRIAGSGSDLQLVLRNQYISDKKFTNILKNECFQYVKKCNLSGSFFDVKWLQQLPSLEVLALADVEIISGDYFLRFQEWILGVLERFPSLKTLDLSGNAIESMDAFSHFLDAQGFTRLETLILRDGGIVDDPMEHLVHFPSLKTLDLGNNNICGLGHWWDDSSIPSESCFPHLETLILENNYLDRTSIPFLALLPALKFLSLSENQHIGDDGLRHFFELVGLRGFSSIKRLELCDVGLEDLSIINLNLLGALNYLTLGGNSFHRGGIVRFLDLYSERFAKIQEVILSDDHSSCFLFMLTQVVFERKPGNICMLNQQGSKRK